MDIAIIITLKCNKKEVLHDTESQGYLCSDRELISAMPVPAVIQRLFQLIADAVFDRRYYPVSDGRRLQTCRIISHRGSHDNHHILENTLAAFDRAAGAGVWGIEMDIRWTRDKEPVIFHDIDLNRLFGSRQSIADFTLERLKKQYPDIPSLSEVVSRFGKKAHLMIEVKPQPWPAAKVQEQRLRAVLEPLEPIHDYHLLTLDPEVLHPFTQVPSHVRVAIAGGWPGFSSRWVRRHGWGGVCGHYLLVPRRMLRHHHQMNQQVGTGYVRSRNCLMRELNRGVDWIFSNHAVAVQNMLEVISSRQ